MRIETSRYPPTSRAVEQVDGVDVRRHACLGRPLRNPLTPGLFFLKDKNAHDDLVHTHNEHSSAALAAARFARRQRLPLVLTNHGELRFEAKPAAAALRLYTQFTAHPLLRRADRVIVLSAYDRERLASYGVTEDRIHVIPNGFDPKELDRWAAAAPPPTQKNRPRILFVGPLHRRKGPHTFVAAIPRIVRSVPDAHFIMVGSGDAFNETMRDISARGLTDRVTLTGRVDGPALARQYLDANVLVLPSYSEGVPTTLLEAMYYGTRFVTTELPSVKEHFAAWGPTFAPGDSDALAENVIKVLATETGSWSDQARRHVVATFGWPTVASRIIDVYRSVLMTT